jgi:microcin C transport system permease protein
MPLYSWNPYESDYDNVIKPPSTTHLFGTDNTGRDVFARLCYGFNVSISFALILTLLVDVLGVSIGAIMGYYGGKFDLFFQRFIEIWQTIPSLFVIIIVSSIVFPNFFILVGLLVIFGWTGMTYYLRGEVYREKAKDYVAAAIALGAKDQNIIFKHILPNSLTPIISTFPFAIIGGISSLVGLDYLGYGLPPPTPSWGQMVSVGLNEFSGSFQNWWLVLTPLGAMFLTLMVVTFIGEALREAFDPKEYSRLR